MGPHLLHIVVPDMEAVPYIPYAAAQGGNSSVNASCNFVGNRSTIVTSNTFGRQGLTQKHEGLAGRFLASFLLSALAIMACNSGVSAQTGGAASLRVSVFDPTHASLPQAETTLINERTGEKRTGATNEAGAGIFMGVGAASYNTCFRHNGICAY